MKTNRIRPRSLRARRAAVEALEGRVLLATLTVTSPADAGAGSLREAIERANLDPDRDTITFAPEIRGTILLSTALPALTTGLDIEGPGAGLLAVSRSQAEGTPDFRVITVGAAAEVGIVGLTISGGQGPIPTGEEVGRGGGILNEGTLRLSRSVVAGNRAGLVMSSPANSGLGGGIYNAGRLVVVDSTIHRNAVGGFSFTTFTPNSEGGGIYNDTEGTLIVRNSTISGNSSNHSTRVPGEGAIPFGGGGGLSNVGQAELANVTIADNVANGGGGAVSNFGSITIRDSILDGPVFNSSSVGTTLTSLGHNLFAADPGRPLQPSDRVGVDPVLAPLGDYGGPTPTHALLDGSPAADAAGPLSGLPADQRGVDRPQGNAPDIGAFERIPGYSFLVQRTPGGRAGVPNSVTVTILGPAGRPLAGAPTRFRIDSGPNAGQPGRTDPIDGRTDADGRIRFTYDASDGPGTDTILAVVTAPEGAVVAPPIAVGRPRRAVPADFDLDGRSDFATYSPDDAEGGGRFDLRLSGGGGAPSLAFGGPDDRPIVGDFDGDRIADIAVYGFSPADGFSRFTIRRSSDGLPSVIGFGGPDDRPVIGDLDGDGTDDLAVYGPGADGIMRFAVLPSSDPTAAYLVPFGGPDDLPLAGDFDGDGVDDLAVHGFSPLDGFSRFAIRPSGSPNVAHAVPFGGADDGPVDGDYDGDGIDDLAVFGFSPLDGFSRFAIRPSGATGSAYPVPFGGEQDAPIAGDFDGDGATDIAVYGFSPLDGNARFAALRSSDGGPIVQALGTADSIALPPAPGSDRPSLPGPGRATAARLAASSLDGGPEASEPASGPTRPRRDRPGGRDEWARLVDEVLGRIDRDGLGSGRA